MITVVVLVATAAAAASAVVATAVNLDSWQAVMPPWMDIAVEEKN